MLFRGRLSDLGGRARTIARDFPELFRRLFAPATLRDLLAQPRVRQQALSDG